VITIAQLLRARERAVPSIAPEASAYEAARVMAEHEVEALPVIDGDRLVGIVTERDYARKLALRSHCAWQVPVREIMSEVVLHARPEQTLLECLAIMRARQVRHLPVLVDGRLAGLLSMLDVVEAARAQPDFALRRPGLRLARRGLN
jgi:CBS domain-containing protein